MSVGYVLRPLDGLPTLLRIRHAIKNQGEMNRRDGAVKDGILLVKTVDADSRDGQSLPAFGFQAEGEEEELLAYLARATAAA